MRLQYRVFEKNKKTEEVKCIVITTHEETATGLVTYYNTEGVYSTQRYTYRLVVMPYHFSPFHIIRK